MIEIFQMSDEEDLGEQSHIRSDLLNEFAENRLDLVSSRLVMGNSEPSAAQTYFEGVVGGAVKQREKRKHRPHSFSICFTDSYEFTDEVLGMGAHGVVVTCVHKLTDIDYAVKLINKQLHPDRQRVFKEVDLFYTCRNCEYILKLHEYFEDDMYFYLVFDKMHGGQLLHHILKRGHLNEREASMITSQIAEALHFMHGKGLAHRDLKPENILCQSESELLPIKLCDFDLASAIRHAGMSTMTTPALSTPVGSAEFMAPEVVDAWVIERDDGHLVNYDKRCDLWSLGVIIYIMLCGYPPFYGRCDDMACGWEDGQYCRDCQKLLFNRIRDGEFSFPSSEWDGISNDAKDLISHLLERDSRLRFSSQQVLDHRWIKCPPPRTALVTASILPHHVRNLETFTNEAMSISKMIDVQLNKGENISLPPNLYGRQFESMLHQISFDKQGTDFLNGNETSSVFGVEIKRSQRCGVQDSSNSLDKADPLNSGPTKDALLPASPVRNANRSSDSHHIPTVSPDEQATRTDVQRKEQTEGESPAAAVGEWRRMESAMIQCIKSILFHSRNDQSCTRSEQESRTVPFIANNHDDRKRKALLAASGSGSCGLEYRQELQAVVDGTAFYPGNTDNQLRYLPWCHSPTSPLYSAEPSGVDAMTSLYWSSITDGRYYRDDVTSSSES